MEARADGASVALAFRDDYRFRIFARPRRSNPSDARQVYGLLGYAQKQKIEFSE